MLRHCPGTAVEGRQISTQVLRLCVTWQLPTGLNTKHRRRAVSLHEISKMHAFGWKDFRASHSPISHGAPPLVLN